MNRGRLPIVLLAVLVACVTVYSILVYLFLPRKEDVDELGLFNPIYTKLHYGRMTYPVHYQFDTMTVHPPLRYAEVVLLMKLGMNLFYAEGFMVCVLTILGAALIGLGRFHIPTKFGLLFGLFASLVLFANYHDRTYSVRPDTQLALAWFAGLILLEDGRLRGWQPARLFAGSLLLTYSSWLHYFGGPAFLGILTYLLYRKEDVSPEQQRRLPIAMLGGFVVVTLPLMILFVVPNYAAIVGLIGDRHEAEGWLTPIGAHFAMYTEWRSKVLDGSVGLSLSDVLSPVLYTKIPAFVLGSALLLLRRETRGIGLASLPLTLFVFLYPRQKNARYFLPELMVYFCGIGVLLATVLADVGRRLLPRRGEAVAVTLLVGLSCWLAVNGNVVLTKLQPSLKPRIPEMHIARAAAKQIVGDNALIGGRIGLWYISGAAHWFDISEDLLWRQDISQFNLDRYFEDFDFVTEHDHMSNTTLNSRVESLPSWYVSGLLKLRGFFFGESSTNMNFFLLRPGPADQVTGYLWRNGRLLKFEQRPQGQQMFCSLVCTFEAWPPVDRFQLPYFNAMYLPKAAPGSSRGAILPVARLGSPQEAVVTTILPLPAFVARRDSIARECRFIDQIPGDFRIEDHEELLRDLRQHDRPIAFHRTRGAAILSRLGSDHVDRRVMILESMEQADPAATIEGTNPRTIRTASQQWSYASSVRLPATDPDNRDGWIHVKARVAGGRIAFGILDKARQQILTTTTRDRNSEFLDVYLYLEKLEDAGFLIIQNAAPGGRVSEVIVKETALLTRKNERSSELRTVGHGN